MPVLLCHDQMHTGPQARCEQSLVFVMVSPWKDVCPLSFFLASHYSKFRSRYARLQKSKLTMEMDSSQAHLSRRMLSALDRLLVVRKGASRHMLSQAALAG